VLLEIILSIIGIIVGVVVTIVKVKQNKDIQKIEVTANQPMCFNFTTSRRAFVNGYSIGVVKKQLPRKNGTHYFEFFPLDVEQGENLPRPDLQRLVVNDDYIKRFAKGEISPCRELIFFTSRDPTDYPEKMIDTTEGKWMTKEGQLGFLKSQLGKAIPQTSSAMTSIMNEFAGGEMTASEFAKIKETAQKYREIQDPEQTKKEERK